MFLLTGLVYIYLSTFNKKSSFLCLHLRDFFVHFLIKLLNVFIVSAVRLMRIELGGAFADLLNEKGKGSGENEMGYVQRTLGFRTRELNNQDLRLVIPFNTFSSLHDINNLLGVFLKKIVDCFIVSY